MKESKIKSMKRRVKYSVAILCLVLGCMSMVGCKGEVNLTSQTTQTTTQAVESQKSFMPEGNKGMEEQVIGGVGGAVREGEALIEGIKIWDGKNYCNKDLEQASKNILSGTTKPELHIQTIYFSKTLGKNVIIDGNIKTGTRVFCELDGTMFFRIGEGFKNDTAEVGLQKYVAMKGLANAIDGK